MEEEQEARNAEYEFKIGLMDPSREQNIIKKAKANRRMFNVQRNQFKAAVSKFSN